MVGQDPEVSLIWRQCLMQLKDENQRQRPRRRKREAGKHAGDHAPHLSATGGQMSVLPPDAQAAIHEAALVLLEQTGIEDAPDKAIDLVCAAGGWLSDTGRLCFPPDLVDNTLSAARRELTLFGRGDRAALHLGGDNAYVGTGGASPVFLDIDTHAYRPATLTDLYHAARIVDQMDHIHFFSRPVAISDFDDPLEMDINTAWACLSGTAKHVMVSASTPESVDAIAQLAYQLAGSEAAFRAAPFLSLNINHAVPPMRFDSMAALVLMRAAECGIPAMVNTFGQLGASSPVTIAGCVAQTIAETLAGMVLVHLVAPGAPAIFGPRPMITDLRTGAMSGGGGEQAKLTAAAMAMARFYGLPNSTIAGATDSKIPDAQSGYEKCLNVTLALQAGADIITQAAGAQASLMGASLEAYVIDNDMLGSILSAHTAIDVSPQTLNLTGMQSAITDVGHFLGEADTLARMNSDFLYPGIGDRRSIEDWQQAGGLSVWDRAHEHVRAILDAAPTPIIDPLLATELMVRFDLCQPEGNSRKNPARDAATSDAATSGGATKEQPSHG